MELSLIGLQNAGKTSLVNVIATGAFREDMIPTVGFNMRKVTRGAVTIKLWDLGGQVRTHSVGYISSVRYQNCMYMSRLCLLCPILVGFTGAFDHALCPYSAGLSALQPRFRSMWERYCRGVQAVVYVVDSADHDALENARVELHELLSKPSLAAIPLLVLGNKNDMPGALSTTDLIDRLDLKVGLSGASAGSNCIICVMWMMLELGSNLGPVYAS